MNDVNPNPRPIYRVLTFICAGVIVGLVMLAGVLALTFSDKATSSDIVAQGRHRDCVTTLSTARRSVFDNVDIYKAIQIDQLSGALLAAQSGVKASPETIAAFEANAVKLHNTLAEARRLQPAGTLDGLIAKGGVVAGRHYEACPD